MDRYFVGVDVGSSSVRAGVFNASGRKMAEAKHQTLMFKPQADFVEQSSDDIWRSVCIVVKEAVSRANIKLNQVKGVGFDATCSLVVLDKKEQPLTVSPTGRREQNIIMWMDHRAIVQAESINATQHPVLTYVGNRISPEMDIAKLLWLKENMSNTWSQVGYFFALPDFLTWKATQDSSRSLCSTVCKWLYLGHERKWDTHFLGAIGLSDLLVDGAQSIGQIIKPMGEPVGEGLSDRAANELGLLRGTAVGTSMIDAHAGGIGVLGAEGMMGEYTDFNRRLALISGTSSCHMAVSKTARFIDGVWGAYYGAMIPDYWLNEGGQSATGALIDHVISSHPSFEWLKAQAIKDNVTVYQLLNEHLLRLAGNQESIPLLAKDIHVLPYFHGNRSPRANPHLTGTMTGLRMSKTIDDMALTYLATIQAIALGTRHIIEVMNLAGYEIDTIMICGGGTKNSLFMQEHANATGCVIVEPEEREAVLLGSAMLGAVASRDYVDIPTAMNAMSRIGNKVISETDSIKHFYDMKYRVFHQMYTDDMRYKQLMSDS